MTSVQDTRHKIKRILKNYKYPTRFQWQDICAEMDKSDFSMMELKMLALMERLPTKNKTKRELCKDLSQVLQSKIDKKKQVLDSNQCINTTSILLTKLEDIPPEFFYTYIHNEKLFCEDIRELHSHIETNGNKHPIYPNEKLEPYIVRHIKKNYRNLVNQTKTMNDFDLDIPVASPISILTQKATDFIVKLYYPNDIQLFLDAEDDQINRFINSLIGYTIISEAQGRTFVTIHNLVKKKTMLVELLLHIIERDSSIIFTVEQLYNINFNNDEITRRLSTGMYYSSDSDSDSETE